MSLSAGSRLGPYVIEQKLGAGGMGEVYRARDQRLERTVALKVLTPECCGDEDSRERFRREARALSKLSHPNVCSVYDVGTESGRDYFVMELLTGETLAARLERGRIPIQQALQIGRSIAMALAASHRVGLVHRDLKPGNVMLTSAGVKLLDFGLARVAAAPASQQTVSNALTTQGTLLGTYQYMSPEQVKGEEVDSRSDVFSFGVVMYEMLTGHPPFTGDTSATLAASILRDNPRPILSLEPATPTEVAALIDLCLAKNRDERWQSTYDLQVELGWLAERPSRSIAASGLPRRLWWPWAAVLAIGMLLIAMVAGRNSPRAIEGTTVRAAIPPPPESQFISVGILAGPAVLSPDGRRLAFVASSPDGKNRLWIRSLDSAVMQALAGTEGASNPFWSADNEALGFFADRKLKKIALVSGAVIPLCDVTYGAGGTWNREGIIVFAPGLSGPLQQIPAGGGSPRPATTLEAGRHESTHRWPMFLPDGRRFLYVSGEESKPGEWRVRVASLDGGAPQDVLQSSSNALYANGMLIYVLHSTLLAQPVDERSLRAAGDPIPLAEDILRDPDLGRAVFSASQNGTLVYQLGAAVSGRRLVWIGRNGNELGVVDESCSCIWPRLSPDGSRAAVARTDMNTGKSDIWIYELSSRRQLHLTFEDALEANPVWAPGGNRVIFNSTRNGARDIQWKDALGRGEQETLKESKVDKYVLSVSSRGVVYGERGNLWLLPLEGTRASEPQPLLTTQYSETFGEISPDGRWLVYQSDYDGKNNVYATSFPSLSGRWPISESGGILPRWSADSREIFYLSQDHSTLFASTVRAQGTALVVTGVQHLFSAPMLAGRGYPYDVAADGQRFLVVRSSGSTTTPPLTLVLNWASELKH